MHIVFYDNMKYSYIWLVENAEISHCSWQHFANHLFECMFVFKCKLILQYKTSLKLKNSSVCLLGVTSGCLCVGINISLHT